MRQTVFDRHRMHPTVSLVCLWIRLCIVGRRVV